MSSQMLIDAFHIFTRKMHLAGVPREKITIMVEREEYLKLEAYLLSNEPHLRNVEYDPIRISDVRILPK